MNIVAHYSKVYLALTKTWIYSQIIHLKRFIPIVITRKKENINLFPLDKIYSLEDDKGFAEIFCNKLFLRIFGYKSYSYFYEMLSREKPVLLHSHFGYDGYDMLPLKRKLRIPMVTTFYGLDLSLIPKSKPVWREKYKKLFNEGEMFLVEGSHMRECLIELGCPEGKARVQHLGIDLKQIAFIPRKIGNDGKVKILVSGSFIEKKGIPYALEAFARVKQKHKNIELTLIGDAPMATRGEAEKRKIMDVIHRYHLDGRIKMLGYQPYSVFLDEIKKHHIFLSPSVHSTDGDTEGGAPVSIIEASASGMPVVSTDHCDIPEVIVNGKTGYLTAERNVDALVERLEYLILNHLTWEEMGRNGRMHIEEKYDVIKQAELLEEIYKLLI